MMRGTGQKDRPGMEKGPLGAPFHLSLPDWADLMIGSNATMRMKHPSTAKMPRRPGPEAFRQKL